MGNEIGLMVMTPTIATVLVITLVIYTFFFLRDIKKNKGINE